MGNSNALRVAVARQPLERRAAGIAETKQASALVEGLAGRVVERLPEHLEVRAAIRTWASNV